MKAIRSFDSGLFAIALPLLCWSMCSLKGICPGFLPLSEGLVDISFSLASSLTAGIIIYFATYTLPRLQVRRKKRKAIALVLNDFLERATYRLKAIGVFNDDGTLKSREAVRTELALQNFGDRRGGVDSIAKRLIKIHKDLSDLHHKSLLEYEYLHDDQIMDRIQALKEHKLFSQSRQFLNHDINSLEKKPVKIGGYIWDFSNDINDNKSWLSRERLIGAKKSPKEN